MWALLGRHQSQADLKKADCTHSLFLPPGETSLRKKKKKKKTELGIQLDRGTLRMHSERSRKHRKSKSNKLWRESTFGIPPSGSPLMYSRQLSVGLISVPFCFICIRN